MLTTLRLLNIAVWSLLFVYMMSQGGWAAIRGKEVRKADPMRLSVAAVSLVIVLGNLRWLIAPESDAALLILTLLTFQVGVYKICLGLVYGRGTML